MRPLPGRPRDRNRNGSASTSRQKPAATGPTSDKPHQPWTKGQRALPISRAGKAKRWGGGVAGTDSPQLSPFQHHSKTLPDGP